MVDMNIDGDDNVQIKEEGDVVPNSGEIKTSPFNKALSTILMEMRFEEKDTRIQRF